MRTIGRLTANKVKNAKPLPGGKTALLCDGGGLWLQVSKGKEDQINKSWIFRYAAAETKTSRTGRRYRRERQMGLGPIHTVGLADAREMAREARLQVRQGKDPLDAKHAARAATQSRQAMRRTFGEVAESYLQKHEDSWKSHMHRAQWRGTLRDYILPVLGEMDVEAIDTEVVLQILEPIWSTKPETASRVRGRIETVLDFAGRNGANPARWKGHLEHKLAKRNKARTVKHLPALSYVEVGGFMAELRGVTGIAARALELTILCATRTNETMGARWCEFDLDQRLWVIPATRTKRDREHRVPLSDAAIAVINAMAAIRQDDHVFPVGMSEMRLPCTGSERHSDPGPGAAPRTRAMSAKRRWATRSAARRSKPTSEMRWSRSCVCLCPIGPNSAQGERRRLSFAWTPIGGSLLHRKIKIIQRMWMKLNSVNQGFWDDAGSGRECPLNPGKRKYLAL